MRAICSCESPTPDRDDDGMAYCARCGHEIRTRSMSAETALKVLREAVTSGVTISDASVEAVADRVLEQLDSGSSRSANGAGDLIDANEVARRYGVTPDWVYRHKQELGVIRLGTGPKAHLRFDPARIEQQLRPSSDEQKPSPPKRARRTQRKRKQSTVGLLPIKGER